MSATSSIEWTDKTWNPVTGCDKVSPGCAHCYAEGVANRFWPSQYVHTVERGFIAAKDYAGDHMTGTPRRFTDVMTHEGRLLEPLSWRKPARVFVNSMSDLFHDDVPDAFIVRVFGVMARAPQHTFQILTKRPQRMLDLIRYYRSIGGPPAFSERVLRASEKEELPWPLPNVWLGVSVENLTFLPRIDALLNTPAAVRFVSLEPLLGPVDLKPEWLGTVECCHVCGEPKYPIRQPPGVETRQGWPGCVNESCVAYGEQNASGSWRRMLDWVIVGGESGPGARPFDIAWARSIVSQCKAAGVPVFVKQLGANPFSVHVTNKHGRFIGGAEMPGIHDRKGGEPGEWPEDLRVREFPREARR